MSLLVQWKILKQFVNTLTVDDKYSLLNKDNLTQPMQILFSQKQNSFFQLFSESLKYASNIEHFPKKDDPHSQYISEITDTE